MALSLIVFAGFYPPARRAMQYADVLAQAVNGRLVLLHINRASLFDPNDLVAQGYHREELTRQADTAAILSRQAEGLQTPAAMEVATDLLPAVAQDLASRYQPALFVLSQADEDRPAAADLLASCVEHTAGRQLPAAGGVAHGPGRAPAPPHPHCRRPRTVCPGSRRPPALRQLLALPGTEVVVAHVSSGVEDDEGCALALRAVQASGLVEGLPTPELRGYEHQRLRAGDTGRRPRHAGRFGGGAGPPAQLSQRLVSPQRHGQGAGTVPGAGADIAYSRISPH